MTKRLWSIPGNTQMLDGGSMFGNAPRPLWERWTRVDAQHRIPLACRAMLIEDAGRYLLVETGIGTFFPPAMRERYGVVEREHVLLENLEKAKVPHTAIDVVVLSHLHFDHAGGLFAPFEEGEPLRLLFPKARFVVSRAAWERAVHPHARDRASYVPELPGLLEATGRLEIVDGERSETLGPDYRLHYSEGHTPGQMLLEVQGALGPIVFGGDLVPGRPWVHLPITMGYDRFPERLIDEKKALLEDLVARSGWIFFTHDADVAMSRVVRDEKGRFCAGESLEKPEGLAI
jgi:glyoxylase-like metal-dependent hydrolase (beta-lactamase superfamily II)